MRFLTPTFLLGLALFLLSFSLTSVRADDLDVKVFAPTTPDQQALLTNFMTDHPTIQFSQPILVQLTNLTDRPIYLPSFNVGYAPLTVVTSSTWAKPVGNDVPLTAPEIVVIPANGTFVAVRDLHSLLQFTITGTYQVNFSFDCNYTFYPVKDLNTSPDSYISQKADLKGALQIYISPGNSTWGWGVVVIPGLFVLIVIVAFFFVGGSAPKTPDAPTEMTLSGTFDSDKE